MEPHSFRAGEARSGPDLRAQQNSKKKRKRNDIGQEYQIAPSVIGVKGLRAGALAEFRGDREISPGVRIGPNHIASIRTRRNGYTVSLDHLSLPFPVWLVTDVDVRVKQTI